MFTIFTPTKVNLDVLDKQSWECIMIPKTLLCQSGGWKRRRKRSVWQRGLWTCL